MGSLRVRSFFDLRCCCRRRRQLRHRWRRRARCALARGAAADQLTGTSEAEDVAAMHARGRIIVGVRSWCSLQYTRVQSPRAANRAPAGRLAGVRRARTCTCVMKEKRTGRFAGAHDDGDVRGGAAARAAQRMSLSSNKKHTRASTAGASSHNSIASRRRRPLWATLARFAQKNVERVERTPSSLPSLRHLIHRQRGDVVHRGAARQLRRRAGEGAGADARGGQQRGALVLLGR